MTEDLLCVSYGSEWSLGHSACLSAFVLCPHNRQQSTMASVSEAIHQPKIPPQGTCRETQPRLSWRRNRKTASTTFKPPIARTDGLESSILRSRGRPARNRPQTQLQAQLQLP